jgi:competence protein ComEA
MITLTRAQIAALAIPLVALLGLAGSRIAKTGTARGPERAAQVVRDVGSGSEPSAPRLVVHVTGAVRHGGLYRLREGSRVADAIRRAGGPTRKALLSAINLAAPLADGQQVLVPVKGPPGSSAGATGGKVSLATADVAALDELPGIGPVTAQKIVDWRTAHGPFGSVDDLDAIPGIGPARVEQLRDLVTP